ncbi:MAG: hypothetical protein KJO46_07590, partial [Gammaproteobacteria bacterium]|nr:hypothetical protein [Gammaproteobacteria bacterium]
MTARFPLLVFATALIIAGFCYSASFGSEFQLDDLGNLGGLATVTDRATAADFVLGGAGGPTGRPLSLLTFVLQADEWQNGPDAFQRVNIAIHLLNALLLAWGIRLLFVIRGESRRTATIIGCMASSVWVLLPLIASATLLVVQRMTTLSATFALLGLIAYLGSRTLIERAPRKALFLMALSLTSATVLSTLAKEIGALLPAYVLVLEATMLQRPAAVDKTLWRGWAVLFLWLPTLFVLAYLVRSFDYPEAAVLWRGFDATERLMTEARILWVYLGKAIVGLPGYLGIYHEDVEIVRSLRSPAAMLAVIGWLGAVLAAVSWRRRYPLFALAVLWFLAGHLLESTVLSLELYFEHRNYLPIIGPIIALTAFFILHSDDTRRAALRAIPVLLIINAWFVFSIASLQGDPSVAARYWALKYPDSVRAVTNLVAHQLTEEGVDPALETIRDFTHRKPEYGTLNIQELNLMCMTRPDELEAGRVEEVRARLTDSTAAFVPVQMFKELFTTVTRTDCPAVSAATVVELAKVLRDNPRYASNGVYNRMHNMLMAKMHLDLGDTAAAIEYLYKAHEFGSLTIDLVLMTSMTLVSTG